MAELFRHRLLEMPPVAVISSHSRTITSDNIRGFEFCNGLVAVNAAGLGLPNTVARTAIIFASLGMTNMEICEHLPIKPKTLKNYLPDYYNALASRPEWGNPTNCRTRLAHYLLTTGAYEIRRSADPIGLTPKEHEVVSLAALGNDTESISAELGIKPGTVKNHVHNILRRTYLPGREGIVMGALLSGEVELEVPTEPTTSKPLQHSA